MRSPLSEKGVQVALIISVFKGFVCFIFCCSSIGNVGAASKNLAVPRLATFAPLVSPLTVLYVDAWPVVMTDDKIKMGGQVNESRESGSDIQRIFFFRWRA